ncbi:fatty acid hydroxylase domain-containing protein 2-like [Elgaria multicarinata webbii]|uniref:fatty acid hydroxylase domain-containing protein 2-like n=1 Tax=Elgaria multicarinata webbii TaxID=159646 RepID=UPI002FCCF816
MRTKAWLSWLSGKRLPFILGLGLLMLIAFQNSFTGQLQKSRKASGFFLQTQWENVYHRLGGNESLIFFCCTSGVPLLVFCILNGTFMVVDATGKPKFITRYRIQLGKNEPADRQKMYNAFKTVMFNLVFISQPMLSLMFLIMKWRTEPCSLQLPTLEWFLLEIAIFTAMEEVMFYYSHRLFHHPLLYKHFHKKHHEWTAPISISSIDIHPVEHVFSGMLPLIIGPVLLGSHVITIMVWLSLSLMTIIFAHCGYHFPFVGSSEFHDFHHLRFNQCYGVLGVLDYLHGTDKLYKQSKAYERDHILWGFTPLSESIPDFPKRLE